MTIEKINYRATDTRANSAKRFAPPPYSQATGELVGVALPDDHACAAALRELDLPTKCSGLDDPVQRAIKNPYPAGGSGQRNAKEGDSINFF